MQRSAILKLLTAQTVKSKSYPILNGKSFRSSIYWFQLLSKPSQTHSININVWYIYVWLYEMHAALFNGKRLSSLAITIISLFCLTLDPRPSDIYNCICIFVFFWFNWECSGFLLPHFVICSKTDRRPPHKSSHAQDFIPILRDDHSWFLKTVMSSNNTFLFLFSEVDQSWFF